MIDTLKFFYEATREDRKVIKETFRSYKSEKEIFIYYKNPKNNKGIRYAYITKSNLLFITVNPKEVLNKFEIINEDYVSLVEAIEESIYIVLFNKIDFENLNLSRIDYKKDIVTDYIDIYIDILKKLDYKYRKKKKKTYETSVHYKGGSYNLNLYNKEQERRDKDELSELDKYLKTLRLEIQIKRPYLKACIKKYGLLIELKNFFDDCMRLILFEQLLEPLVYRGDYFTMEESEKMLKEKYTLNMVNKLINFQKSIYNSDVSTVKKSCNRNTFRSYKKKLEEVGINPIILGESVEVKKLPNLISYLKK